MRVRVGIIDFKGPNRKVFYAIIQEYGRREQVVTVRRLNRGARVEWRRRIRDSRAKRGVKPDDLINQKRGYAGTGYPMNVRAMAGKHFVHIEARIDAVANRHMADFWDKTLNRVGAA